MARKYTTAQAHYALGVRGERAREARNIRRVIAEANATRRFRLMLGHTINAVEQGIADYSTAREG